MANSHAQHVHHFLLESTPRAGGLFHGKCKLCPATTTAPASCEFTLWKKPKDSYVNALAKGIQQYRLEHQVALTGANSLVHDARRSWPTQLRFASGKHLTLED